MALITSLITGLVIGAAEKLLKPATNTIESIENAYTDLKDKGLLEGRTKDSINKDKHDKLVSYLYSRPWIANIINKCGWERKEVDIVAAFLVIITKKFIRVWKKSKRK